MPAIVNVPTRSTPVLFAAISNVTVPFPVPLAPELMVIQGTFDVAVHAHADVVVTLTVRLFPPFRPIERLVDPRP